MGYLSNRSINLLNAHSLLVVVSDQAKVLFSAAFFLSEGIPPWAIALLWAWHFAARLLARTGTIRLVRHAGLKASIILGALGNALAFFLLVPVHGLGWLVVADLTACTGWPTTPCSASPATTSTAASRWRCAPCWGCWPPRSCLR